MNDETLSLATAFAQAHPAEAGRVLNGLPGAEVAAFLAALPPATAGAVLDHMLPHIAAHCLSQTPPAAAAKVAEAAAPWAAAAALRGLGAGEREAVLERLSRHTARRLRRLIDYPAHTAGAWADPRGLALARNATVDQALAEIRQQPDPLAGELAVIEDGHRVEGLVTTPDLLRADPDTPLGELARRNLPTIPASLPLSAASEHRGWAALRSLPVTDANGRLVGLLPYGRVLAAAGDTAGAGSGTVTELLAPVGHAYWLALAGVTRTLIGMLAATLPEGDRRGR